MTRQHVHDEVRPGDEFLAEAVAGPDLPTHHQMTGEVPMLDPSTGSELGSDWRSRASCRDVDPEIFFPTAEAGPQLDAEVAAARAVCGGCTVRAACLDFARKRLPHGIAGGLTPGERRRLDRRPGSRKEPRPRTVGRSSEVAEAGRAALRAGQRPAEVAREFGVSDRTVCRWVAANRSATTAATNVPATPGRGAA